MQQHLISCLSWLTLANSALDCQTWYKSLGQGRCRVDQDVIWHAGFLQVSLMDENGNTKDDLGLPKGTDDAEKLASQIQNDFGDGKELVVTVLKVGLRPARMPLVCFSTLLISIQCLVAQMPPPMDADHTVRSMVPLGMGRIALRVYIATIALSGQGRPAAHQ